MIIKQYRVAITGPNSLIYDKIINLFSSSGEDTFVISSFPRLSDAMQASATSVFEAMLVVGPQEPFQAKELAAQCFASEHEFPIMYVAQSSNEQLEDCVLTSGFDEYLAIEELTPRLLRHAIVASVHRTKMQSLLRHERDLLQTLMDSIPDTIYFKDKESRFTRINKAQEKVLGIANGNEAIGKTDFDFFDHAKQAFEDEHRIIETGEPIIDKQETVRRADGEHRYCSATKVPIRNKTGAIIGTVGITRDITDRVKAEKELAEVKERLEQTMQGIQEELEMARQIQKSLLPTTLPEVKGMTSASAYIPCSAIGGDFYDVMRIDENRLAILMFDVVGHGVPAALIAALGKAMFGVHMHRGTSPSEVLDLVNKDLFEHFNGKRYLAAYYGILDTKNLTFEYSKGGHPPAILIHGDTKELDMLSTAGLYVGLFHDSKFEQKKISYKSGDRLIIFTDGLIEAFDKNEKYFGLKSLKDTLVEMADMPIDVLVSAVLNKQRAHSQGSSHIDDITMLALQFK